MNIVDEVIRRIGQLPVGDPNAMRAYAYRLQGEAEAIATRATLVTGTIEGARYESPAASRLKAGAAENQGRLLGTVARLQGLAGAIMRTANQVEADQQSWHRAFTQLERELEQKLKQGVMAHLLFDTDDMGHAAAQMGQTAGDLLSRIGGIGPGAILMPPALEVETAEVVAGSMRDLAESGRVLNGANAADLVERTAIVLAETSGDGVVLSAGSFIRGLSSAEAAGYSAVRSGLSRWLREAEPIEQRAFSIGDSVGEALGFGSGAYEGGERLVENSFMRNVGRFLADPIDEKAVSSSDREFAVLQQLSKWEDSGFGKGMGRFNNAAQVYGVVSSSRTAWDDTAGEHGVARGLAVGATATIDTGLDTSKSAFLCWVLLTGSAGAASLESGTRTSSSPQADSPHAIDGFAQHGAVGAVTGYGHGVMASATDWREKAEQGKAPTWVKVTVKTEDWFIDHL